MESLMLTDRGLYWLKVNIASEFGHDKLSFDEQAEWTSRFDTVKLGKMAKDAENPFAYMNAVRALIDHECGLLVKYIMPIDCSNQALQLYGVLSGDLTTAQLGSLGSGNVRNDAYQMIADYFNGEFKTKVFTREVCKKPLMITLYGSLQGGQQIADNLKTDAQELFKTLGLFGEYVDDWLDEAFSNAMLSIAPYAMSVMDEIQTLNNEEIGTYSWVMPDGFIVKYDVKSNLDVNIQRKSVKGVTFSCHLTSKVYAPSKGNRGMAPNVIHSVDGYVMRQLKRRMGDVFMTTIHDSYSVHPNQIDKLRHEYSEVLVEILESDLLESIMSQIAGARVTFTKNTTLTPDHIRNSVYHLS